MSVQTMVAWYPELHTFWMERRCVRDVARPLLQASFQGVCPERQNFTSSALKEIKKKKKILLDPPVFSWSCGIFSWELGDVSMNLNIFSMSWLKRNSVCSIFSRESVWVSRPGFSTRIFSLFYFLCLFMFPFYEMLKAAAIAVQLRRNTNTSCDCRAGRRGFKTSRVRQRRALFLPKNKINK